MDYRLKDCLSGKLLPKDRVTLVHPADLERIFSVLATVSEKPYSHMGYVMIYGHIFAESDEVRRGKVRFADTANHVFGADIQDDVTFIYAYAISLQPSLWDRARSACRRVTPLLARLSKLARACWKWSKFGLQSAVKKLRSNNNSPETPTPNKRKPDDPDET